MSRIKAKDTTPERVVRSLVFAMGYRYRLHDKRLPGKPDLVFRSRRKIIFVHGCFWHMHSCRYGQVKPKTNEAFWATKRQKTVERDRKFDQALIDSGWETLIIWECETKNSEELMRTIKEFLK